MSNLSQVRTSPFTDTTMSLLWRGNTFQWNNKNYFDEIVKVLNHTILQNCAEITNSFPQFALLDLNRLVKANFDEYNRKKDSKQMIFCAFNTHKAAHTITSKDEKRLQIMFAILNWALDGFATISGHYSVRGQVIEVKLVLV